MKVTSIVGARPQFIKAAPVSSALRRAGHTEFLLHTGQHYDYAMSQIFFDQLEMPKPDANLGVGSGRHGWQTGQMLMGIEEVLCAQAPDWVLVYGDTNSTLAGALAACKLRIPLGHVEAGLRSYNREMPEEHNRVVTDHCSEELFCPTQSAVGNLAREGIAQGVHWVGDTMYDAVLQFARAAERHSRILEDLHLTAKGYLLATLHRPYNTDRPGNLRAILAGLAGLGEEVIFPVHPRTRQLIAGMGGGGGRGSVRAIEPVGYLDMLVLEQNARLILTDSGGVQKEAFFSRVPCITLRPETEWVETVQSGWNRLVDAGAGDAAARIGEAVRCFQPPPECPAVFGDGRAAERIVGVLE